MANKTIYIWGYNGHKKLDENSPERYFSIPQKFTSHSHQPQAESKLLNSAVNKILVTVKDYQTSVNNITCQHEDKTYLIDNNGCCQIISNKHQRLEESIVRKGEEEENIKLKQVAAGDLHTIGLTVENVAGEINDAQSSDYIFRPFTPTIFCKQISCGKEHVLLLSLEGRVYSFGMGSRGQLGHGVTGTQSNPKLIEALETVSMATICCGGWHSTAVSDIQDLYIWGWNESGQLGFKMKRSNTKVQPPKTKGHNSNSSKTHISSPPDTVGDGSIQTGDYLCDLAKKDWENRDDDDKRTVLFHLVPAILDLPGGQNVSKVSCGSRHTAAVTDNGTLFTWGWGEYGQLGHGSKDTKDAPTQVHYFTENKLAVTDIYCQDWNTACLCSEKG